MASVRYRISEYGTIYLSPQIRRSASLKIEVEQVAKRQEEYRSDHRIPSQSVWGYVTMRVGAHVLKEELVLRFQNQALVIWDSSTQYVLEAICVTANAIYRDIINELAFVPRLPGSPPPKVVIAPQFSLRTDSGGDRATALSFTSLYQTDFDVTLYYDEVPPPGPCVPVIAVLPPKPPITPELPPPDDTQTEPVPDSPPVLPPGTPATPGTSIPPANSYPGDNKPGGAAVNTRVRVFIPGYVDPSTPGGCSIILNGVATGLIVGYVPASEISLVDTTPQGLPPQGCPAVAVYKRVEAQRGGVTIPGTVAGVAEMTAAPYLVVDYV